MSKHRLRPLDLRHGVVELPQGSGGRATAQLIDDLFMRHFRSDALAARHDAATLPNSSRISTSITFAASAWAIANACRKEGIASRRPNFR